MLNPVSDVELSVFCLPFIFKNATDPFISCLPDVLVSILRIQRMVCCSSGRMRQMQNQLFQFLADENGTTAIEYGMIASLLGIAILGSASSVGSTVGNLFNSVATNF